MTSKEGGRGKHLGKQLRTSFTHPYTSDNTKIKLSGQIHLFILQCLPLPKFESPAELPLVSRQRLCGTRLIAVFLGSYALTSVSMRLVHAPFIHIPTSRRCARDECNVKSYEKAVLKRNRRRKKGPSI